MVQKITPQGKYVGFGANLNRPLEGGQRKEVLSTDFCFNRMSANGRLKSGQTPTVVCGWPQKWANNTRGVSWLYFLQDPLTGEGVRGAKNNATGKVYGLWG